LQSGREKNKKREKPKKKILATLYARSTDPSALD
jgi:hypothetical protein